VRSFGNLRSKKPWPKWLPIIILLTFPSATAAQVVPLATTDPIARLLPNTLDGVKATGDIKRFSGESFRDLVGDEAAVYQEYRVGSAASRDYRAARVDVFETQNQFAAFGLFTFGTGVSKNKSVSKDIGSGGASVNNQILFWKGRFFVRVSDTNRKPAPAESEALARAVADLITAGNSAVTHPPLLDSLPETSLVPGSKRYFLGPEALNTFVAHGRERARTLPRLSEITCPAH
jgi:hypothetical protein